MTTADRPLNVLYIIDYWASPGGTERHLAYLLESLDRKRFNCHVVIFHFEPNELVSQARERGIEIVHLPVARYYTPRALFQALRLRRFIRERRIDVVQTFHYKADVYGAFVAWLAGVRHIVSSKRDAADYKKPFHFFMHRLVAPLTPRYIAVSEAIANVIRARERVSAEKITVIHNGVDLGKHTVPDAIAKRSAKARIGWDADDFVIGMSAWFRPEKDHQLLLDAFVEIGDSPRTRLLLIGGGPLLEHYRRWVQERGLADRIHIAGAVDDVRPYLAACDIACLVPRINEGFSNSILEKMATGLPVIATDVGGNKESVAQGVNGYVIQAGDRTALVRHLRELRTDVASRERMARAARERVEQLFSLQEMVRRHASLYASMAGAPARSAA